MKYLMIIALLLSFNAMSEESNSSRLFDQLGVKTVVNNPVTIPGSPFNYYPEVEGPSFGLLALQGQISADLACDGLNFSSVTDKLEDEIQQTFDYAMSNWEMIGANWLIFSQPQVAAIVENVNDLVTIAIDATMLTCQGARNNAKERNSADWAAQKAHQACLTNNVGNQLKCLSEAKGDAGTINTAILEQRATINEWVKSNGVGLVNTNPSEPTGNTNTDAGLNAGALACTTSDISPRVCEEYSKILPDFKFVGQAPDVVKPLKSIPEYIDSLQQDLTDKILEIIRANTASEKTELKAELFNLSFGVASLGTENANKLERLYINNQKTAFKTYIERLSGIWSYRATRRLLAQLKFGISDGAAKQDLQLPKDTMPRILAMLETRVEYLKSIEDDYNLAKLETQIWDGVDAHGK